VRVSTRVKVASRPVGVIPLITDKWSRVSKTFKIGVSPHGAYVLTTPASK
jgi:hypothetical protein